MLRIKADPLWRLAGLTALHIGAYSCKSINVVRLLLEVGGVPVDARDGLGMTAFFWTTVFRRDEKVIELLLEKGAVPEKSSPWKYTNQLIKEHHCTSRSGHRSTLLQWIESPDFSELKEACQRGLLCPPEAAFWKDLLLLLTAGCPNSICLHKAARLERCIILLGLGANPRNRMVLCSAIHSAAARGHTKVVDLLIQSGVNIDEEDGAGRTPLLLSAVRGHVHCVQYLLSTGANLEHRMPGGTIFELAKKWGQHEIVSLFLVDLSRSNAKKVCGKRPRQTVQAKDVSLPKRLAVVGNKAASSLRSRSTSSESSESEDTEVVSPPFSGRVTLKNCGIVFVGNGNRVTQKKRSKRH
ncbi:ankyrin repeat domain-containing protein 65-like isoform X2 [Oscarella lobularis]